MLPKSQEIIRLIAIAGEAPADVLKRLDITGHYYYKLMQALQQQKKIHLFTRDGLKGYRLTPSSKQALLRENSERYQWYLTGNAETNRIRTEYPRRLRLHLIASTYVTLLHAGVQIFPDIKPDLFQRDAGKASASCFYSSRELKNIGPEHIKIRSSRAMGLLLSPASAFLVYNTGDAVMKWERQSEIRLKAMMDYRFYAHEEKLFPNSQTAGIMLGRNMETGFLLLTSDGGFRRSCFRLDGSFEQLYFLPETPEGEIQLQILCDPIRFRQLEEILLCDMRPRDFSLRIVHDGIYENRPVLLAWSLDIERLKRFRDGLALLSRKGMVYCFDFQSEILRRFLGEHADIFEISLEKVKRRLFPSNENT